MVGEKIPLRVQLHDGNPAADIVATLIGYYGNTIATSKLAHYKKGLYFTNDFVMPSEVVTIQIMVEGTDKLEQEYELAAEQVFPIPRPKPVEKVIQGAITERVKKDFVLTGVVDET